MLSVALGLAAAFELPRTPLSTPGAAPPATSINRPFSLPAAALALGALAPMPAHAEGLPIIGHFLESPEAKELGVYLAQTVINWGVPATVALFFVIATSKGPPEDQELPPQIAKALGLSKEPKEYLKIERLNSKLLSFDYSLAKASVSKESALRTVERLSLEPSAPFTPLRARKLSDKIGSVPGFLSCKS